MKTRSLSEKIIFSVIFIIFILYSALLIYPLVWGILSSLKGAVEYYDNVFGFPQEWKFSNYITAFREISDGGTSLLQMFWNSLWFAGGSALITVEFTTIFAYVLNKYRFRGRGLIFGICLFIMSVPVGASFVSMYRLMHALHLTDSYLILLTATNVFGMNLILVHSFYSNVSWAYAESAQMDGANFYQIYFCVMRAQAKPMMITIFLLLFIAKWNDYMSPLLYLSKMPTLSTGLYRYQTVVERTGNYPILFAGLILSLIPIFVLYAIFCDKLMGSFSIGGLKG